MDARTPLFVSCLRSYSSEDTDAVQEGTKKQEQEFLFFWKFFMLIANEHAMNMKSST
jgi:hypothetical protein